MARGKRVEDTATIQMALVGYELEKQKIEDKIRELRSQLRGRQAALPAVAGKTKGAGRKRRNLSPAARRRIAAAQRKRWAEHRKRMAQAGKSA
jgi:hypothetical protein